MKMNAITPPDTPATRAVGNVVDLSAIAPSAGPGETRGVPITVSVAGKGNVVTGPTTGDWKSELANMLGTRGLFTGFRVVAVLVGSDSMKDPRVEVLVNAARGVGTIS